MFGMTQETRIIDGIQCVKLTSADFQSTAVESISQRVDTSAEGRVYSTLLITRGRVEALYEGCEIDFQTDDLHTYGPGMPLDSLEIRQVTDDFLGFRLVIDERMLMENLPLHNLIRAVFFPLATFGKPLMPLTPPQARKLECLMQMLHEQLAEPSPYQQEAVLALCRIIGIMLLQIQDVMTTGRGTVNSRTEELFVSFMRLVPKHFIQHHDLAFYADRLCITTAHLSRIVRQMSGQTVLSFIEQALVDEAAHRLRTTDLSVTQLAYDLGFSDQSTFTKFFRRKKGLSPREYRQK